MNKLIEADAALEVVAIMACPPGVRIAAEHRIDALPAVDAVPVVHGRWKSVKALGGDNYPYWNCRCSECGYTTAMPQYGWVYCPHCGAKMDGGDDDESKT